MTNEHQPAPQTITTPEQLEAFLRIQKAKPQLRLGTALLQEGLITHKQLNIAIEKQLHDRKTRFGDILVAMGAVTEEVIRRVLSKKFLVPGLKLRDFHIDAATIKIVPFLLIQKHRLVPLYRTRSHIVVAMEDPLAADAMKDVEICAQIAVTPVLASREDLEFLSQRFYGEASSVIFSLDGKEKAADIAPEEVVAESDERVVRLVDNIILDAFSQGASEIHVESIEGTKPSRVRFRKSGTMMTHSEIPAAFRVGVVSRIKVMAGLSTSEKTRSQDGKMTFTQFGPEKVELRVSTMHMNNGLEDVLMRILSAPTVIPIDSLGMATDSLEELKILVNEPRGLLIACGPTDSGRTSTLHSLLAYLNTPDRKVWTAEDPVKIVQEGLRQVHVDPKIGQTFATVLRDLGNTAPAVIMVGATRDAETAKAVIEACLGGHLVLSATHAANATESIVRLRDLGIDPFELADVLLGAVGQRLVRCLCTACRKSRIASNEELTLLAQQYCASGEPNPMDVMERWRIQYGREHGAPVLYSSVGCKACNHTGYKGRIGVYELLVASGATRRKIRAKAEVEEIFRVASAEGMKSLKQDGIEKVLQGRTSFEEVQSLRF